MQKVRLAIVGCGTISQLNAPGYLKDERCEVAALCDPLKERAEARARQWGISPTIYDRYDDVLNDAEIDAVELLTPTYMHRAQAVEALKAGKHVSCQKPMCATVAEADEIADAAKRAGTIFRVTENFLYYPPIVKAKELLDEGAIGDPSLFRVHTVRGVRTPKHELQFEPGAEAWRRDSEANPGGMMYDDAWHKYATAMWWLGDIETVYGIVTKTDDFMIEALSAAMWRFTRPNCLGMLDFTYAEHMPIRGRYSASDEFFEIQGSHGAIWVTRCSGELHDLPPVMLHKGGETVGIRVPMDGIEGFNGAAADFIDSIIRGEQPKMDVQFSKKVLQVALAVYQASESQGAVAPGSVG